MIRNLFQKLVGSNSAKPCAVDLSRGETLETLLQVSPEDAAIREELEGRLERLRAQGVVSISGGVRGGQYGSTRDDLWTLNNVLRQYEEGKGEVKTIRPRP